MDIIDLAGLLKLAEIYFQELPHSPLDTLPSGINIVAEEIKTYSDAMGMIEADTSRLGASAGIRIVQEAAGSLER
jgi:hypothetical protein